MVSSREAFVADAVTAGYITGVLWGADAVDGGLMALKVRKAGEVC
jgi:hypothetical protein